LRKSLIFKDLQKVGPQKNQEIFFGIFQALGITSAPPATFVPTAILQAIGMKLVSKNICAEVLTGNRPSDRLKPQ
jgi:hypothetical protein